MVYTDRHCSHSQTTLSLLSVTYMYKDKIIQQFLYKQEPEDKIILMIDWLIDWYFIYILYQSW